MAFTWQFLESDGEFFARELESFVPAKIFDAHAHLYCTSFWDEPPALIAPGPAEITLAVYREQMQWLFPGRTVHGVHFPLAFVDDTAPGNAAGLWGIKSKGKGNP